MLLERILPNLYNHMHDWVRIKLCELGIPPPPARCFLDLYNYVACSMIHANHIYAVYYSYMQYIYQTHTEHPGCEESIHIILQFKILYY